MKSIMIGNDIRIVWPVKLGVGTAKLEDYVNLTVEVRPSVRFGDLRNHAPQAPRPQVDTHVVTLNGDAGRFEPHGFHGRADMCRRDWPQGMQGHEEPRRDCGPRPPLPVILRHRIEGGNIIAVWSASQQFALGDYDIILYADKGRMGQACADQCRFVRLVAHSSQADDTPCGGGLEATVQLRPVTLSMSGLSAYDIAVGNGFNGTEAEWLESLGAERICKLDIDKVLDGKVEAPTTDWCGHDGSGGDDGCDCGCESMTDDDILRILV